MNAARRLSLVALTALCAFAGALAFTGAPAQAKTVHLFEGAFGSKGSASGQFNGPTGIAVNDTTHDVYVVDQKNNRVEEFNSTGSTVLAEFNGSAAPTGAFSKPTAIAVDNSGNPLDPSEGDVYVVDDRHSVIDKFSASGTYLGQLTGTCEKANEDPPCPGSKELPFRSTEPEQAYAAGMNLAVAPNGTLWVLQNLTGQVDGFSDALDNVYESKVNASGHFGNYTGSQGFGVDSEGDFYINTGGGHSAKFNSSGEELLFPFASVSGDATGLTVDPVGKEVYINNGTSIGAFALDGTQIESFGSGDIGGNNGKPSEGVAVDGSDATVYASDGEDDSVAVFDAFTLPTVAIEPLNEQQPRSLTLNGTVTPEGSSVTSCEFEYVLAGEYEPGASNPYAKGVQVPCSPASLGSGKSPVSVGAHVTGLTPEASYDYRLVAENGAHLPSATPNQQFTAGPVLGGESVTDVASESATLNVPIDPNGDDTHYYFQYGPSASYGFEAPTSAPGVDIGSAPGVQDIAVHIQTNLLPSTVYHYRVVVSQGGEEFYEPDHTFRTQSVGGSVLPDGRAWELVSPPNKKGAMIEQFTSGGDEIQAADDGSAITYLTQGPAVGEDPQGKTTWDQVLSARGASGWHSEDLTLPGRLVENQSADSVAVHPEYTFFSPDLSSALVEPQEENTPPLSPEATERTLYVRDDATGSFTPLVTAGNVPPGTEFGGTRGHGGANEPGLGMYFVTATPDLSHVVLMSKFALTPEASDLVGEADSGDNIYEWSAGRLQLVNVLPNGKQPQEEARLGNEGSPSLAPPDARNPSVLSSNGQRIAWQLGQPYKFGDPNPTTEKYGGLYVRDMVEERTLQVGGSLAIFQWMSSDGSEIFYLENGDLYVFDFETDTQTDLTADHGVSESSGDVQELVSDVSQDGSYVYFVAKGVLADASGAVSGEDNLYLLHDTGSGWSTTYIATLSPEDEKDWYQKDYPELSGEPQLSKVTSRVSPNGRYLAFMSSGSLTGYDNTDALNGHPDEEVYLYHAGAGAEAGRLVCASCDPTGARPIGVLDEPGEGEASSLMVDRVRAWAGEGGSKLNEKSEHDSDPWLAAILPPWDDAFGYGSQYQPRYLSDGGRLFFDSPDALVPQATNGLMDVYEYEPAGEGDCTLSEASFSEASGGCVNLISSGTSSAESAFFDASENGDDVFFITAAKLVAADYDNGYDVYDAHVCSAEGVPCVSEPVSPPPCSSGDSCKAAPSPQPEIFGPTPSATFSGTGNVLEEVKGAVKPKAKAKKKTKKKAKRKKAKGKKAGKAGKSRSGKASAKDKR